MQKPNPLGIGQAPSNVNASAGIFCLRHFCTALCIKFDKKDVRDELLISPASSLITAATGMS